jgi:integrase
VTCGKIAVWCSVPWSGLRWSGQRAPGVQEDHECAGLGDNWKPLELRTSFVSLMSGSGVPVEEIARLVGRTSTRTTEVVYRRELRPVITTGAEVMDKIFLV